MIANVNTFQFLTIKFLKETNFLTISLNENWSSGNELYLFSDISIMKNYLRVLNKAKSPTVLEITVESAIIV